MSNGKRPVYLVVSYDDPADEQGSFVLHEIKQTQLAAATQAAKYKDGKVKKGFVTT